MILSDAKDALKAQGWTVSPGNGVYRVVSPDGEVLDGVTPSALVAMAAMLTPAAATWKRKGTTTLRVVPPLSETKANFESAKGVGPMPNPQPQAAKGGPRFWPAPEIEELARDVIPEHHDHLVEARIGYLWRSGTWEAKGKTRLGQAVKVSARESAFTGLDFVIVINRDAWQGLSEAQRPALVDHELSHLGKGEDAEDGSARWEIWPHDVEEFRHIIDRHGLWEPDLRKFGEAAAKHVQQLTLSFNGQTVETTSTALHEVAERIEREARGEILF